MYIFVTVRLGLEVLGRKIIEAKYLFHQFISQVHIISMAANTDVNDLVALRFVMCFHCYSFSFPYFLGGSHYEHPHLKSRELRSIFLRTKYQYKLFGFHLNEHLSFLSNLFTYSVIYLH